MLVQFVIYKMLGNFKLTLIPMMAKCLFYNKADIFGKVVFQGQWAFPWVIFWRLREVRPVAPTADLVDIKT